MGVRKNKWVRLCHLIAKDVPGFEIKYKEDSIYHRLIGEAFTEYKHTVTVSYPVVWCPHKIDGNISWPIEELQVAWVRLLDQRTFFGLLSKHPKLGSFLWRLLPCSFWSDLRATRRAVELGMPYSSALVNLKRAKYLPFWWYITLKTISKPSPYKEMMSKAYNLRAVIEGL